MNTRSLTTFVVIATLSLYLSGCTKADDKSYTDSAPPPTGKVEPAKPAPIKNREGRTDAVGTPQTATPVNDMGK